MPYMKSQDTHISKISTFSNVKVLTQEHNDFPKKLNVLKDTPDVLFAIGNTSILNDLSIAIVGSRKCTNYGKDCAFKFANEISNNNIRIVSGLAEGIDTAAHRGSVTNKTIAVIGSGFDKVYPKSNLNLIYEILANDGVILTEYFFDVDAYPFNFPKRNRLVAAMTDGIIVIEAGENSGALITTHIAKELNKNIYVVPANINNSYAQGSNKLLHTNVKIALSPSDILKDFIDISLPTKNISMQISEEYKEIYDLLLTTPLTSDEICKKTNLSINKINSTLTLMELEAYILKRNGKFTLV